MVVRNNILSGISNRWFVLPVLVCCFMLIGMHTDAQFTLGTPLEKKQTREGNKQFKKENYAEAEADYKKALDKKNNMPEATFNLGDAQYQQKRYDEAIKQFQLATQNPDSSVKAKAFHNLGNTYLQQNKWEDAIKSYKESLRINPKDADTKYNLAYANAMLMKQNQQNKDNKKNDKNKDKDKKDDKNKQDQQNKKPDSKQDDQQAGNGDKNKDAQDKKPGGQPKLTKEEAEKLLQALMNEEQKTSQKVQQKQVKAANVKIQKDW